jgi:hypothetical protein
MPTRAERFKSEQAKEHARQHAQAHVSAAAPNGSASKATGKSGTRKAADHKSTPLTSPELRLNMSPSARHQRRG